MKRKRDESRDQQESTAALHTLEAAFGDAGLARDPHAIGDLLHFIDDMHGPKVALIWQLHLLGLGQLVLCSYGKKRTHVKSTKTFEKRFRASFDMIFDRDELDNIPLSW